MMNHGASNLPKPLRSNPGAPDHGWDRPSWMGKASKLRRQNARSAAQERDVAQSLGGRVQGGSGSSWRAPRDVKTPDELIECKYTDGGRYSLSAIAWNEYKKDALQAGKEAAMIIEFSQFGLKLKVVEI